MAEKEATVYIVDVGKSMGATSNGRSETDLDYCMHYVWDKITTTVSTGRKTALAGVIGLRTDDTDNVLAAAGDDTMEHISLFQPIEQILMPDLRNLDDLIKLSHTDEGDAISTLILAIQLIADKTKKLKYTRRIFLITNGLGSMDDDGLDDIIAKIKADNIELTVLGVDFDDPVYGFREKTKSQTKQNNETILRRLTEGCEGNFGTMEEAVSNLNVPRIKEVRPVTGFRGTLTLGNPQEYDTAMSIDVERYPKIMVAKPPSASNYVVKSDLAPGEASMASTATTGDQMEVDSNGALGGDSLTAVKSARAYQVEDSEAPGGKREVELDMLAKGYNYGSTAVPISESEWNVTKLEENASKSLQILGFVEQTKYKRYFHMSKVNQIIAQRTNDKANMALSAFAHALQEMSSYAVARFVSRDGNDPVLLLLAPLIETDYECLVDVELPFAEDIRQYRFPPLDRIVTVSGRNLLEHRNLPNPDLMNAMDKYVHNMDLSTFGSDEDGNPAEFMPLEDTFSPILHRINAALRFRAAHPGKPVPPAAEILTRYSNPPAELIEQAQNSLANLIKAANVKKVPPKTKGRKRTRDTDKPLSGLDIGALLGNEKRVKISAENAIPEFKQLLTTSEDPAIIRKVSTQLGEVIESYITHSVGDSGYSRAIETIRVFKDEMIELEEPDVYNQWLRRFKQKLLRGDLGGERKEMWWLVKVHKLSLIHKALSDVSGVTEDEANAFMAAR